MFLKKRIIATAAVIAMAAAAVYGSTQEMSQTQESGSGLQLFRGKETIYCWYSDEALSGYINAAAVSFGEQNSGVRVIPVLTSDSEYLEAINQETLHSDQIPDIYLLSSDSLERLIWQDWHRKCLTLWESAIQTIFPRRLCLR